MLVRPTKCFSKWCSNDKHLITSSIIEENTLKDFASYDLYALRRIGFDNLQIKRIFEQVSWNSYKGFARFKRMRYISWNWDNGDKILYPLNSENELYIGTDHPMWCSFWPFFRSYDSSSFWCNLPIYTEDSPYLIQTAREDGETIWFGGQSHFGHFGINFLAPLFTNTEAFGQLQSAKSFCIPQGYSQLHYDLIRQLWNNPQLSFQEVSGKNGIFILDDITVPALTESTSVFKALKGQLEMLNYNRIVKPGKYIFISRSPDGMSDRLFKPSAFINSLTDCGFTIVDPTDLDIEQRLSLLGDAEYILTESGSCGINAYLFGNRHSIIKSFIPRSVLKSHVDAELNMLLPALSLLAKDVYIPLETSRCDDVNNFYNKCIPPSIDTILSFIRT
jgi:hypothetical protein